VDIAKTYGFTDAEIRVGGYDVPRFNNRLIFPIFDLNKNIVALSGRTLDNETLTKYTATPNSDYYKKGLFLYGLKDVVKGKPITLVEGNLDYVRIHSLGINALAQLGSALTKMQCHLLKSLTNEVNLMYDGDEAGRKALMNNILPLVECGITVFVSLLPDGLDPDIFFKNGIPIYMTQSGLGYYLRKPNTQFITNCLRVISKIADTNIKLYYIEQLSSASELSISSIRAELRKIF
jgi:DNA primase